MVVGGLFISTLFVWPERWSGYEKYIISEEHV
jgi:hypothetical protein